MGCKGGGGGGLDPGCILKGEPTRAARDLMWGERKGERGASRMNARFLGTTLHCAFPPQESELLEVETASIHLGHTAQGQAH